MVKKLYADRTSVEYDEQMIKECKYILQNQKTLTCENLYEYGDPESKPCLW